MRGWRAATDGLIDNEPASWTDDNNYRHWDNSDPVFANGTLYGTLQLSNKQSGPPNLKPDAGRDKPRSIGAKLDNMGGYAVATSALESPGTPQSHGFREGKMAQEVPQNLPKPATFCHFCTGPPAVSRLIRARSQGDIEWRAWSSCA